MPSPELLLNRLDQIGRSLEQSGHALALLGLGSVGLELERLDEFSDLDFFAVVETGAKQRYLDDLYWLTAAGPVAFKFKNTADGYKLLYEDGVFCEFAVFELAELEPIPFTPGRVVWHRPGVDASQLAPRVLPAGGGRRSSEWIVGEALTNLLVGLARDRRGEKLVGMRFIQHFALDRVLELTGEIETPQPGLPDAFSPERRFEKRFPGIAVLLPEMLQGYMHNRESALAILAFLEHHFPVNPALAGAIRSLAG